MKFGLFFPLTVGLAFSFAVIALLRPVLPAFWRWAWQGVVQHCGLWLVLYGCLLVVFGRPWFAMAIALAFMMLLVQVSNAKYHSLREAFVFQDFEYFTDAIRHPRLYIPFLGWWKFALIVVAVSLALGIGLWLEPTMEARFALSGQLGESMAMCLFGAGLLVIARGGPQLSFVPDDDMRHLGFLACLWRYGWAERLPLQLPDLLPDATLVAGKRPDLVVVQSESFFDPRPLFPGIRQDVLKTFDALKGEALLHGPLTVPAWGANTVRSEFAFLSGAPESMLGVHRFNPYRQILRAKVFSLAKLLRGLGYRTVCVHPYPASFYGRDKVYPYLGFDEFIDIRSFPEATRFGPYISDQAVAEKIKALLGRESGPLFVFVITMENHGPLHLEKPNPEDVTALYAAPPPENCDDLTVYLRHLRNADRMMGILQSALSEHARAAKLCWYGDHVPIMADVYRQLGDPDGRTEYFVWSNRETKKAPAEALSLNCLAQRLLEA